MASASASSMNSLTARLHIEGHSKEKEGIKVFSFSFNFSQSVDEMGNQSSAVRMGLINLSISSNEDGEIIQWMLLRTEYKKFRITFSGLDKDGQSGPVRKIFFEDALLVNYSEVYVDETNIVMNLVISARKINIAGYAFEIDWNANKI